MYKQNNIYLYQTLEEVQEFNNEIIKRRAKKMESLIEKILMGIAWVMAIILGVGAVPILLSAIVGQ